jgi:hypothetical protein
VRRSVASKKDNTMNVRVLSEGSQNSIIKSQCTHHDPVSRVVMRTGVATVTKVRRDGFNWPPVHDTSLVKKDQSVKEAKSEEEG